MNTRLRKDQPTTFLTLSEAKKDTVENLRTLLTNQLILTLPRTTSSCILDPDARDSQIVCVLLRQQADGKVRPIDYWSRTLTSAEQKLKATCKESLAVVWAVRFLQLYTGLNSFIIRTQYEVLKWVLTAARHLLEIVKMAITVTRVRLQGSATGRYRAPSTDALSNLITEGTDKISFHEKIPVLMPNEPQKQEDVEAEHIDEDKTDKEWAGSHGDTNGEKRTTCPNVAMGGAGNRPSVHQGRTDHRPSKVHVHLYHRRRIGPRLANRWRVAATRPNYTTIKYNSSMPSFFIITALRRDANVQYHAATLLLAPHGQQCLQFGCQVQFVQTKSKD